MATEQGATTAKSKKGKRGPAGPAGPQGAQGLQGPAGVLGGAAGGDLTGTYPNPQIAPASVGPAETDTIPAAKVMCDTCPTVSAGSTTIPFDFEQFDSSTMHDNVTNNQSLIAPITGVYLVDALVGWNANTAGLRSIVVTGDSPGPADIRAALPSGATLNHASGIVTMFAGDELHVDASQTSDTTVTISGAQFSMIWLGPYPPA